MATLTASTAMKERLARAMPSALVAQGARIRSASTRLPPSPGRAPAGLARPALPRSSAAPAQPGKGRQAALLLRIRELSPILFAGAPVPMMCGVRSEIIRRLELDDDRDLAALRAILRKIVAKPEYQTALAAEGAVRLNLAGEVVDVVSAAHRTSAKKSLEALRGKLQNAGGRVGEREA